MTCSAVVEPLRLAVGFGTSLISVQASALGVLAGVEVPHTRSRVSLMLCANTYPRKYVADCRARSFRSSAFVVDIERTVA